MKIQYKELDKKERENRVRNLAFSFELKSSIMKAHYKELARMSVGFSNNSGRVKEENRAAFLALVDKINDSDSAACEKSHAKCAAKKAEKSKEKVTMSFEEYCSDMLDIHFDLLSREEKTSVRNAYRQLAQ